MFKADRDMKLSILDTRIKLYTVIQYQRESFPTYFLC